MRLLALMLPVGLLLCGCGTSVPPPGINSPSYSDNHDSMAGGNGLGPDDFKANGGAFGPDAGH